MEIRNGNKGSAMMHENKGHWCRRNTHPAPSICDHPPIKHANYRFSNDLRPRTSSCRTLQNILSAAGNRASRLNRPDETARPSNLPIHVNEEVTSAGNDYNNLLARENHSPSSYTPKPPNVMLPLAGSPIHESREIRPGFSHSQDSGHRWRRGLGMEKSDHLRPRG